MPYSIRRPLSTDELSTLGSFSPLLSHLLYHRGISDAESAGKFVAPDYVRDTHDPFLLKDAEKAAGRIIQAIENNERIAIYSDYDADGIPAAVIWNDFFGRIGYKNFSIYIPHRHDEGFGVNEEAIDQLASEGVKLIITADCGITDVGPISRAVKKGIDVIITDHHEPPAELPPAFAIVDHKQSDCLYPDKNLCGSGVAFKLIQAIIKKAKQEAKSKDGKTESILGDLKDGHEKWLLDMVGIATLSDMVPLTGENRAFAYYGMEVLRKSSRKGLMRLLAKLKISQKHLTEDDIAFMITPRINAASRMGAPMDAFNLLAAQTDEDADIFSEKLEAVNTERKGVVASLVKEVKKTIGERHGSAIPSVIVLGNPAWRPSLLGLAANSCAEEFDRPVFLWGRDGGDAIKGSCRSEGRSHVVEIMRGAPTDTFTHYGGHKHSGGFAVSNEQIHFLEQRLNEAMKRIVNTKSEALNPKQILNSKLETDTDDLLAIDAELSLDALDYRLYDDIAKLAPFGMGNPKPVFLFKNVLPDSVRSFGKANDHVEIVFKKTNGMKIPAISFFNASEKWADRLLTTPKAEFRPLDLVATVEKSMFRGRPELRLRVVEAILTY